MILLKHYPLEVSNKEHSLPRLDKSVNIALFILNHLIKLSNNSKFPIIFIGYFAYDAYFNPNKKLDQQSIEVKNVPLECISSNLDEDVLNIYNTILKYYMDNNDNDRFNDEIKVIEYQPFFQFYDKRVEFLYKGEVFLTIFGNNDYCIPYQSVHFKKHTVYIGTFNVCFMYLLTKFHYQYINKDKSDIDLIRSFNDLSELSYFVKNKESVDNWEDIKFNILYQGLLVKCKSYPLFLSRIQNYPLYFIHWNNWKDEELGVNIYNKQGRNIFGILLQYIKMNVFKL